QGEVRKEDQLVVGPGHPGRHAVGGDTLRQERAVNPAQVRQVALRLVAVVEELLGRGVVDDRHASARAGERQVRREPLDLRERGRDGLEARGRLTIQGYEV